MTRGDRLRNRLARAQREAANEERRAARAAVVAARYERPLPPESLLASIYESMASTHRHTEERHRTVAALYHSYARMLRTQLDRDGADALPSFLGAVKAMSGAHAVSVTLFGGAAAEVALASDETARTAVDLEFTLGEGPGHDCLLVGPLRAAAGEIEHRWPAYGRATLLGGVGSLAAVPLRRHGTTLGNLVVYDTQRDGSAIDLTQLSRVGDAFVDILLADQRRDLGFAEPSMVMAEIDFRAVVHQAAGMLAHQLSIPVADAMVVLRARAFADSVDVTTLAAQVVEGAVTIVNA